MTRWRLTVIVTGIILGTVLPAAAQAQMPPRFELSAGYQYTHVPDENLPLGFAIDGARYWNMFGLVGEGGWAHRSDENLAIKTSQHLWHIGAGPRWISRKSPRATPFGQVIAGALIARTGIEFASVNSHSTDTHFMLQPGAGINVIAGDGWGVFGSVDYRRVFVSDDDALDSQENQFRVFVGVRMILE